MLPLSLSVSLTIIFSNQFKKQSVQKVSSFSEVDIDQKPAELPHRATARPRDAEARTPMPGGKVPQQDSAFKPTTGFQRPRRIIAQQQAREKTFAADAVQSEDELHDRVNNDSSAKKRLSRFKQRTFPYVQRHSNKKSYRMEDGAGQTSNKKDYCDIGDRQL